MSFKKRTMFIFILVLMMVLTSISTMAAEQLENRMKLIKASQLLAEKQNTVPLTTVGLLLTNYGAEKNQEVCAGLKMEKGFASNDNFKFMIEGIYVKEKQVIGFFSLKYYFYSNNFSSNYFGVGKELSNSMYQFFTGFDIRDNYFLETKFINNSDNFEDVHIYVSTGFKFGF